MEGGGSEALTGPEMVVISKQVENTRNRSSCSCQGAEPRCVRAPRNRKQTGRGRLVLRLPPASPVSRGRARHQAVCPAGLAPQGSEEGRVQTGTGLQPAQERVSSPAIVTSTTPTQGRPQRSATTAKCRENPRGVLSVTESHIRTPQFLAHIPDWG